MEKQMYVVMVNQYNDSIEEYGFLSFEKAYSFIYETIGRDMVERLLSTHPIQQGSGGICRIAEGKDCMAVSDFTFRDLNCTYDANTPHEEWRFDNGALCIRIKTIELKD